MNWLFNLRARINQKNRDRSLRRAARNGNTDKIHKWLEKGAEINAPGRSGNTALHFATKNGHTKALLTLIDKGAAIEARDAYGRTPLATAALYGQLRATQALLRKGADINTTCYFGKTLLHMAATLPRAEIRQGEKRKLIKLLARKAIPLNSTDMFGDTALHKAVQHNFTEGTQALLDVQADPARQDGRGYTALELARRGPRKALEKFMSGPAKDK